MNTSPGLNGNAIGFVTDYSTKKYINVYPSSPKKICYVDPTTSYKDYNGRASCD
ncbi:MAG: hypothetical protein MJ246_00200 [Clostridia bacterium]|nr:hypothetical protein [Clostridia bacterium]